VNPLLADLRDLGESFVAKGITIALRPGLDLWPAAVEASRLQTSILRLILNAQDAMPSGGEIVLATRNVLLDEDEARRIGRTPGPFVEIRVIDSGLGMSEDVLQRATEPFFTTKPVGEGAGLGLSTVHGFALQAGGHLSLSSTPGKGTEVRLLLPAKPPPAVQSPADAAAGAK
jgi:signal transduction histidine kinase